MRICSRVLPLDDFMEFLTVADKVSDLHRISLVKNGTNKKGIKQRGAYEPPGPDCSNKIPQVSSAFNFYRSAMCLFI